jgi:hypothetical protein
VIVDAAGDGIPEAAGGLINDRVRTTFDNYRKIGNKLWGCVAAPAADSGVPLTGETLIKVKVRWEPSAIDRVSQVFGGRSGVYRVSVQVMAPGEDPRVDERTVDPADGERATTEALISSATTQLGTLLGKGSPCSSFKATGKVHHERGNASYQQTQAGTFTASVHVLRTADEYLTAHPARSASEEEETRQYFLDAQAKGEFPVEGDGTMDLVATHTPTNGSCQGSHQETTLPVRLYGTLEGQTLKLNVVAVGSVKLTETCSGVSCPQLSQGIFCPGGAQNVSRGTSEVQLAALSSRLAGGSLDISPDGAGPATLHSTGTEESATWQLSIIPDEGDDAPAVALAPAAANATA